MEEDRFPLGGAWNREGAVHQEVVSLVVHGVQLAGIRPVAARVRCHRVLVPTGPQGAGHLHELPGAGVPLGLGRHGGVAVVAGLVVEHGGHHVPPRSPARDVVQGREHPGRVERGEERGGHRAHQADALGGPRHRGQRREGCQAPAGPAGDVTHAVPVREEHRVEQTAFGGPGEVFVIGDVREAVDRGTRRAPRGLVVAGAEEESVEVQCPGGVLGRSVHVSGMRRRRGGGRRGQRGVVRGSHVSPSPVRRRPRGSAP